MNIGDLVELSSYAKGLKKGYSSLHDKVGIITEKANPSAIHELYFVHWLDGQECFLNRGDLKYVRRNK